MTRANTIKGNLVRFIADNAGLSIPEAMEKAYLLGKQDGLEQSNADGCRDCAFVDVEEWEMPCNKCKRNCKDYWRKKAESEGNE